MHHIALLPPASCLAPRTSHLALLAVFFFFLEAPCAIRGTTFASLFFEQTRGRFT